MADLCEHGYRPEQCAICRVLRTSTAERGQAPPVTPRASTPAMRSSGATVSRGRDTHSTLVQGVLILVGVLAVVAVIWILATAIAAILHLLELVAVAAVAGYVGYRYGHHRGRREPREQ